MVVNRKPTGRAVTIPAGLAWGAVFSLFATLAGAAVTAWLLEGEMVPQENTGYWVMGILLTASFLGATVAKGKTKRRALVVSLLSGVVYFGLLMTVTALFFGGQYSGVGETALLIFCGCMLSVLWELRGKKSPKRKGLNR